MSVDLSLISTRDMLEELGKRAEYLFISADFPDAQETAPQGHTGFLTVLPQNPERLIGTIAMVGRSIRAASKGDHALLAGLMMVLTSAAVEDEEK